MITASSNGLAPATQVETINAGAPSQLAFTSSAFTAPVGSSASTSFTVSLEDQYNNVTSTQWNGSNGSTTTVNLSSSSPTPKFAKTQNGATSATLQVSIAANAQSVTAWYGDPTGGTPTLTAAATGLTSGTQVETMTLIPAKLVFTTQPVGGVTEGTNFATQPVVTVEDANGNTVTTDTGTVALSINSYSAGTSGGSAQGTLGCTANTVNAVAGVATFAGCQITGTRAAGTYTLSAARGRTDRGHLEHRRHHRRRRPPSWSSPPSPAAG